MNKAIFLDRDGTIIKDKGYINSLKDVVFYDFTFSSLRRLQKYYKLFIVTNQQGIAKGLITYEQLNEIHNYILSKFNAESITIQKIYFCPHSQEDNCECRKPKTKFIREAAEEYNIDLKNSYVIGDHLSDALLGHNSGAKGIYLLTGHGLKHRGSIPPHIESEIIVTKSLKFAVDIILNTKKKK
ncbi:MAG: D-glycero-alpha-D-manno-heptose-1,7-bisphosphate 7-phosphatase [Ignavibacteriaceae bacterium]